METKKSTAGPLFGFLTLIFSFITTVSGIFGAWPVFWICFLFAIASLVIFARLQYADFVNFFVSRQARYGANVALGIIGVIGIAVFVNAIVAQRFDRRLDLTQNQLYSLSEQTQKILESLNLKIHVTSFLGQNVPAATRQRAIELLELYQRETEFLTVTHANPQIDIQLVEKYNILRDGTIIFESQERQEKVTILEEQKFTNALLKLVRNEIKKVYFLVGHEEHDIDDFNSTGYSAVRTELENQSYAAIPLSLLTQPAVPADCEALVIAGPKNALTRQEIGLVSKYLTQNGKLLLLLDPSNPSEDVNKGLVQLMKKWGIDIGNDVVVDRASFVFQLGQTAPFPNFEPHDITRSIMRALIPFPFTRSVMPKEDRGAALSVKSLAKTASPIGVSWGETNRESDGTLTDNDYTPGTDTPGPVSIAVAVEAKSESHQPNIDLQTEDTKDEKSSGSLTRIVVFGDSDFAANAFFHQANRDLFLATINWLTLEEDLIAIRPIDLRAQTLRSMLPQDVRLIQITAVFFIPIIVFTAGLAVWWQRRKGDNA